MKFNEKELKNDEQFVIQARAKYTDMKVFQYELENYFAKKYRVAINIIFNEDARIWELTTSNSKKKAIYPETIPHLVQEMLQ